MKKTKASILIITYNHEKYIENAITSVMLQKTSFTTEVIVSDDCSTDKTLSILKKMAKKYPNRFKIVSNKSNLGINPNFSQALKRCKGEYISVLEGDDYWLSSNKIQQQVDFLENNQDFSITAHNVIVKDEKTGSSSEWLGHKAQQIITIKDVLSKGSSGATCSLVFRSSAINPLPSWFSILRSWDWVVQVLCTSKGKMYYFNETLGVYRRTLTGATAFKARSKEELAAFTNGGTYLCDVFNKYFNYKYNSEIAYNLYNYFYPNLFRIYLKRKEKRMAKKYALKILLGYKPKSVLSLRNWINFLLVI